MKARFSGTSGFTLIEVLVASAILAVLLVLMAQIIGVTSSTTSNSREYLAADRSARLALDRLAFDLGRALFRADVGFSIDLESGNDRLAFFSEVPGEGNGSTISAVSYRVVPSRGLERASVTVPWEQVVFDPAQPPAFSESDYHSLAPGVIRLEVGFLLVGDYSNPSAPDPDAPMVTHAHSLPSASSPEWVNDLRAMVISLAVVDGENLKRFEPSWDAASAALADGAGNRIFAPLNSGEHGSLNPVLSDWERELRVGTPANNPAAIAAIRLYSRVIQLP